MERNKNNLSSFILYFLCSKKKGTENTTNIKKKSSSGNISNKTSMTCPSSNKKLSFDDTASTASSSNATAITDTSETGTEINSIRTFEEAPTLRSSSRFVFADVSYFYRDVKLEWVFG